MNPGIMQGRLLPPVRGALQAFPHSWNVELDICRVLGIDCVEWIYDGDEENPIANFGGARIISSFRFPSVFSLCADYFVKTPLLRIPSEYLSQRLARLKWLIFNCHIAKIPVLVLPFVDDNAIYNQDEIRDVTTLMYAIDKLAKACGVWIALETNLSPPDFGQLLNKCPPEIGVNYDSGNSAALGYNMEEEWNTYGHCISNIHIKDRILKGGSVPLGEGNVNFDMLARMLVKFDYRGNLILQVARGETGKEVEWYHKNKNFLLDRGIG